MDSKLESLPGATTQGTAKPSMTTQQASKSANYKRWVSKNPFLRFGLPLISLTILGAIGLGHLQQGRKDMQKAREDSEWEAIKITKALSREGPLGKYMKPKSKQINLEDELKALHQKIDINNFEYKKVPRPNERE